MKSAIESPTSRAADSGPALSLWKLFGGQTCHLRPLQPGDEAALQEFFRSHTPDTIHERYGCLVATMTPERATQLVSVDQTKECALGIFTLADQIEKIHAVGRYCLDPGGNSAELAFVVSEARRRQGMASTLLRLLIHRARARGLTHLWAQVNTHNASMLGILRRHGFILVHEFESGVERATLPLNSSGKIREGVRKG